MDRHLVLVGGGHAHLFVLEGLAAGRFPTALRVTLISPTRAQVYSGMLPGLIGGRYRAEEITLDLDALARRAGAELRPASVVGLDPDSCLLRLAGGETVGYDLVSFAIGSDPAGADTPGTTRAHRLKPIDQALALPGAVDRLIRQRAGETGIVVVGGGAAGVEIALNVRERLRRAGHGARVRIVEAGPRLLAGHSPAARRAAAAALVRNEVEQLLGERVVEVRPDAVVLEGGRSLRADLVIWAAGAAAPAVFRMAGLATDPAGFLLVDATLRSVSHPSVFAAGDAAALASRPGVPKAGVFAVRAGPVLRDNLAAALAAPPRPLRRFRPPRRYLALLDAGDGGAVLSYGRWGLSGRWVRILKDRIDRRFMARFRP
jgi:selenide,water dikinase